MICIHGKQLVPQGQSGVYFICQFGEYTNLVCRFAKWCKETHSYEASTDAKGNNCKYFATEIVEMKLPVAPKVEEKKIEDTKDIKEEEIKSITSTKKYYTPQYNKK